MYDKKLDAKLPQKRCYGRGTGDSGEGQSQSTTYTHLKMSLLTQYHVQLSTHNEKNIKTSLKTQIPQTDINLTKGIKDLYNKTYEASKKGIK